MVANNAETRTFDKWIDSQECKVNNWIFSQQNEKSKKESLQLNGGGDFMQLCVLCDL